MYEAVSDGVRGMSSRLFLSIASMRLYVDAVFGSIRLQGRDISQLSQREIARTAALVPQATAAAFAITVNNGETFENYTVTLNADIDLNNVAWTPIGTSTNAFKGNFDGNGHTISNLKAGTDSQSNVGLFGYTTDGTIKNIHIHNAEIKGHQNVGVVAGTPFTTEYSNIKVTGLVKVDGYAYVGGMFGKDAYANLTDLTIEAD